MDEPKHRGPQDGVCVGGTIVFEERTSKAMIWSDLQASGDFILEVELLQPA